MAHEREDWQAAVDVGTELSSVKIWEYVVDILNSTTQQ